MTSMTETSKAYADALFSLAMEQGEDDTTLDALHLVQETLNEAPDTLAMLASPAIPKDERLQVIEKAYGGRVPERVVSFLQVMCAHGHIREVPDAIRAYEELHNAAVKLSTAQVTSAVPLTDQEKADLQASLEKKLGRSIRMECSVDEALLGGLVIRVDGRVIDGSLKHRLHEIKEVMNR